MSITRPTLLASSITRASIASSASNPILTDSYILFSAAGANAAGYSNWQPMSSLAYEGTNANGIDLTQSTAAAKPLMRIDSTYAASGVNSVPAQSLFLNGQGLLVEGVSSTNLLTYSENYDTQWSSFNTVETPNAGIAVDGTNTAYLIEDDGSGGVSGNLQIQRGNFTVAATTDYVMWARVKAGSTDEVLFKTANDSQNVQASVNLTTGVYTNIFNTNDGGTIDLPNGYKLAWVKWTTAADTSIAFRFGFPSITRDGTNNFYLDGCQVELGTYPSSYISTSGSAVTRAADQVQVATSSAYLDQSSGISGATGVISLAATKYAGLGDANWVGASFYNSDDTVSVVTGQTATTITVDNAVTVGAPLNFATSAYTLANLKTLRLNAGDGSTWVDLPVNNFIWEIEFTALSDAATAIVSENKGSAGATNNSISRGAGGFLWSCYQGGSTITLTSAAIADITNRRWLIRCTLDSVNGRKMEIFEESFTDTQTAPNAGNAPTWQAVKTIGYRDGGTFPLNMIVHRESMFNLDRTITYQNDVYEGA